MLLQLVASLAIAQAPHNMSRDTVEYIRPGTCHAGGLVTINTGATTFVPTTTTTGGSNPADMPLLVPYDSAVYLYCDQDVLFSWLADPSATLADALGWVSDSGTTGPVTEGKDSFFVPATSNRFQVLSRRDHASGGKRISQRTKWCSSTGNPDHGAPCDADGDCYYAGATCGGSFQDQVGVYLAGRAVSSNATCFVCIER